MPTAPTTSATGPPPCTAVRPDIALLETAFTTLGRAILRLSVQRTSSLGNGILTGELHHTSYLALAVLDDGGAMRISELAQAMELDVSTVSRTVRQLTEAELVEKERDSEDGRAQRIVLTGGGRDLLLRACQTKRELLDAATADWNERDRSVLAASMMRLATSLSEMDAESVRGCVSEPAPGGARTR